MADEEQLEILKQGVEVWNRWRANNLHIRPDLREADFQEVDLRDRNYSDVDFGGIYVDGVYFGGVDLREVDLRKANFRKANLIGANLSGANFSGVDLGGANLGGADLGNASLGHANLSGANLSKASLSRADLTEANLTEADLTEARLSQAILYVTNLTGVNLSGGDLSLAYLNKADLVKADFSTVTVGFTLFADLDLSVVKGLETVKHWAPSTIGIDTIYRSKNRIPEAFLRGCGVQDTFITHVASLTGKALEYYSCFISYSNQDDDFARRLHADLQDNGVPCWFAPEDMKIGDKIRPRIDQSIRLHDKLLVVLSEHSIGSDWVEDEVETAIEEERKREKTVLFPIRLDEAVLETDEAWAAKIRRTRQIGDFSQWKDHDSYQQAFEHLLRDLKAEEG